MFGTYTANQCVNLCREGLGTYHLSHERRLMPSCVAADWAGCSITRSLLNGSATVRRTWGIRWYIFVGEMSIAKIVEMRIFFNANCTQPGSNWSTPTTYQLTFGTFIDRDIQTPTDIIAKYYIWAFALSNYLPGLELQCGLSFVYTPTYTSRLMKGYLWITSMHVRLITTDKCKQLCVSSFVNVQPTIRVCASKHGQIKLHAMMHSIPAPTHECFDKA